MTFAKGNKEGQGWRKSRKMPKHPKSKYKSADKKVRAAYKSGKTPWIPEQ